MGGMTSRGAAICLYTSSTEADDQPDSQPKATPDLQVPSSKSLLHERNVNCVPSCSSTLRQIFRIGQRRPTSEETELLSLTTMTADTSLSRLTVDSVGSMPAPWILYKGSVADQTPFLLHNAVIRRDINMIRVLVSSNPSCTTELNLNGESALHIACKNGDIDIVDEMLNLGCDPNICTGVGIPVHSVLQGMKQGLITEELGINLVQLFLRKGCDLTLSNAEDQDSKTVLLCAAEYGSPACMDILIQAGASVNTMDHNCFSPLYMSTIRGDLKCVKLVLQHGAINVNVQDSSGRTPLIAGLITIISSLTYDRLNNDVYNADCVPDEMIVLNRNNRIAIMEALLCAGADPNIVDRQGRNALGLAFLMLEIEAARNIDEEDKIRAVPPKYNNESRYTLLVRLLVMYGAVLPPHINMEYFSKAPEQIVRLFQEVESIIDNKLLVKPSKLAHTCRMKIRSHLADLKNLDKITRLPLPHKLKNYLQFQYF